MLTDKLFTDESSQAVCLQQEKAWETFLQGIDGFDDDYFEIMEHRHETEGEQRECIRLVR